MPRSLATVAIAAGGTCTVSSVQTNSCLLATVSNTPAGVLDGASESISNLTAHLKVTNPGTYEGTVVFFSGGGGNTFWEDSFANSITGTLQSALNLNYRVIQVKWASAWLNGTAGALALAARPASLIKAIRDDATLYTTGKPFIVVGHSAGSSALAYTLAHYGGGDWIDMAVFSAGPPHARQDYGSMGTGDATWAAIGPALCTTGSVIDYTGAEQAIHDGSYGRTYFASKSACGGVDNPASRDSILRADAALDYQQTSMRFVYGDADVSVATPLGRHFRSRVLSTVTETITTGGVTHNQVPNSASGMSLIDAAITAATFRH